MSDFTALWKLLNVDCLLGGGNGIKSCNILVQKDRSRYIYTYTTGYWLDVCVWGVPGEYKLDICVYPIDWRGPGEYKLEIYVYPID